MVHIWGSSPHLLREYLDGFQDEFEIKACLAVQCRNRLIFLLEYIFVLDDSSNTR